MIYQKFLNLLFSGKKMIFTKNMQKSVSATARYINGKQFHATDSAAKTFINVVPERVDLLIDTLEYFPCL